MMDRQLYIFYHLLLTIRCVLQEYLNRRRLYLIPLCKANCTPGEVGVCRGRPLPYPYGPEIGVDFTYFSIKKVIYLSTRNEFDTNRLSILKNIEIKNITHYVKNPETLTKEDQTKIQIFYSEYDSKVVSSMQFYLNFARHVACKTEPYSCSINAGHSQTMVYYAWRMLFYPLFGCSPEAAEGGFG